MLDETFVTAGLAHHSMEPRSALAYWQNGKCILHGSTQSQSFPFPGIARRLGIEAADLSYISEFCGGGFGSKGGDYPLMVLPALMAKKINRPVMMRVSRHEEYFMGSARPGFQGRVKIGFRADGKVTALDLYIVQENGPHVGFNDFMS
ncbi:MAG: molybdopterin-dependent oxidoreductase, partial [Sphingopyxis sp.]|nr:molybdopterin-dependent oxidoreductase [Sphingopyxis sp.]